jgi:LAS superfamily LD-carboxypeptidase LdcB
MLAHAEEYGWTLPDWARTTGSKPEPWHWEYVG